MFRFALICVFLCSVTTTFAGDSIPHSKFKASLIRPTLEQAIHRLDVDDDPSLQFTSAIHVIAGTTETTGRTLLEKRQKAVQVILNTPLETSEIPIYIQADGLRLLALCHDIPQKIVYEKIPLLTGIILCKS